MKPIPIVDLFAGPGGLGEGFMSVKDKDGNPAFDIRLSIEKEVNAHKTLTWRSFYWQFIKTGKSVPNEYYHAYKTEDIGKREEIIEKALDSYLEGKIVREEARLVELGSPEWPSKEVDKLIRKQLGKKTEDWVLIGGPPCQAYSNVGRSRVGGIHQDDHRVYLYREYLRIIKKFKPAVFIMENVRGLLSAKVGEEKVFDWMKKDLAVGGKYQLHSLVKPAKKDSDFLIKAEEFGIPQKRHRVILLGIRKDLEHCGEYLIPKKKVSLGSIIDNLPKVRSGVHRKFVGYDFINLDKKGNPKRKYEYLNDSDQIWANYINQFIQKIRTWGDIPLNGLSNGISTIDLGTGSEYVKCSSTLLSNHPLYSWYRGKDGKKLGGLANHHSRSHLIQDLMRYLFASLYVEKYETFPRLDDFARHSQDLVPDHANANSGKFTDRFRVQIKDQPATTVTSHISKDGHYFIHYNPNQCRSLTVREAARIQTFPDNYLFRGSRTVQYHQVGNAVPPYLAMQIAKVVSNIFHKNLLPA